MTMEKPIVRVAFISLLFASFISWFVYESNSDIYNAPVSVLPYQPDAPPDVTRDRTRNYTSQESPGNDRRVDDTVYRSFSDSLQVQFDDRTRLWIPTNTSAIDPNALDTPGCYRQVQVWMGKTNHIDPQKVSCPGLECGLKFVVDTNLETFRSSDAVVIFSKLNWGEMIKNRPPGQRWIFYTHESPVNTPNFRMPPPGVDNPYDYVMTFRKESTINGAWGYYNLGKPEVRREDAPNWAQTKTGLIAWLASNCGVTSWKRTKFVKELAKHITVDMYGACGPLSCPKDADECWRIVRTHKFYLALENSECRDYITEKFWRNSLLYGMVPIVYGPPKEDYERIAPPNSFIHLQDFSSFNELVDYLHLVDSNDTLYNSYMEWRLHGSVETLSKVDILGPKHLCNIVATVMNDEKTNGSFSHSTRSAIPDFRGWWKNSCKKAEGFPRTF